MHRVVYEICASCYYCRLLLSTNSVTRFDCRSQPTRWVGAFAIHMPNEFVNSIFFFHFFVQHQNNRTLCDAILIIVGVDTLVPFRRRLVHSDLPRFGLRLMNTRLRCDGRPYEQ